MNPTPPLATTKRPSAGRSATYLTGAAGEGMAQVHLLMRGWVAANVNASIRNNAGFDLTATKADRTVTIAVKSIGRGQTNAQWGRPKTNSSGKDTLFAGNTYPNFVVFIWFIGADDAPTEHRVFIVPTDIVDRDVLAAHYHWHSHKRRDGAPRADTGAVSIGFKGNDTAGNISSNFAQKWHSYENAWGLLEATKTDVGQP